MSKGSLVIAVYTEKLEICGSGSVMLLVVSAAKVVVEPARSLMQCHKLATLCLSPMVG